MWCSVCLLPSALFDDRGLLRRQRHHEERSVESPSHRRVARRDSAVHRDDLQGGRPPRSTTSRPTLRKRGAGVSTSNIFAATDYAAIATATSAWTSTGVTLSVCPQAIQRLRFSKGLWLSARFKVRPASRCPSRPGGTWLLPADRSAARARRSGQREIRASMPRTLDLRMARQLLGRLAST